MDARRRCDLRHLTRAASPALRSPAWRRLTSCPLASSRSAPIPRSPEPGSRTSTAATPSMSGISRAFKSGRGRSRRRGGRGSWAWRSSARAPKNGTNRHELSSPLDLLIHAGQYDPLIPCRIQAPLVGCAVGRINATEIVQGVSGRAAREPCLLSSAFNSASTRRESNFRPLHFAARSSTRSETGLCG